MPSQQTEQKHIIGYDVMGCPMTYDPGADLSDPYVTKVNVIFDPETGSTHPDYSERVNLVELIQTYKDQCGMTMAMRLIKQGVDPAVFADDGQHSGDATAPTLQSAQSIANAAIQKEAQVAALREALGLPSNAAELGDDVLSTLVAKVIEEKYPNIIKQQPAASGTKDGGAE